MKTGVIYGFFWFLAALYSYYLLKNLSLLNVSYQSLFQKNQRVGAYYFWVFSWISEFSSDPKFILRSFAFKTACRTPFANSYLSSVSSAISVVPPLTSHFPVRYLLAPLPQNIAVAPIAVCLTSSKISFFEDQALCL